MIFNTDYWNGLNKKEKEETLFNPEQLGFSLGGNPLDNLKAGIFTGTKNMELTFFNAPGKGQDKSSPESWGKTERQEMKELARVNEVDVTIHATPNMGGGGASLSGFTGKGFSEEAREVALHELKSATEFAADVAEGGPVVTHIDGFSREVFKADDEEGLFQQYPEEKEEAPIHYVDERSGSVVSIPRSHKQLFPTGRDKKTGEYLKDENGNIAMEEKSFNDMEKEYKKNRKEYEKQGLGSAAAYFFSESQRGQIGELRAKEHEYLKHAERSRMVQQEHKDKLKSYQDVIKNASDKEAAKSFAINAIVQKEIGSLERLKMMGRESSEDYKEIYEEISRNPEAYLKQKISDENHEIEFYEHGAESLERQAKGAEQNIKYHKEIKDFGVAKEADTIARAAIQAREISKKKKLKDPLFIAPENYKVEMFGSHPKEYKEIIQKSRETMANKLREQSNNKISKSQANQEAEKYIRGTFDIGHLNMWRKYFQKEPEKFDKWVKRHVDDLMKNNIIGHVHLSDNFGYNDEHLEMGEGNTPLQDFFKSMKDADFKGTMVAEPGGQKKGELHRAWSSALALGSSPVYRIDDSSRTWTDIQGSYFGRTSSPNFLVGDYAPSKDWTLWTEVPLE
jgi:hypothetical protein